jgi:multidrug efflux system membrane fusion protein
VYVVNAARQAQLRTVQEGTTHEGRTHVVVGLVPGERVVVEGQHRLHEGAAVAWDEGTAAAAGAPGPAGAP